MRTQSYWFESQEVFVVVVSVLVFEPLFLDHSQNSLQANAKLVSLHL